MFWYYTFSKSSDKPEDSNINSMVTFQMILFIGQNKNLKELDHCTRTAVSTSWHPRSPNTTHCEYAIHGLRTGAAFHTNPPYAVLDQNNRIKQAFATTGKTFTEIPPKHAKSLMHFINRRYLPFEVSALPREHDTPDMC